MAGEGDNQEDRRGSRYVDDAQPGRDIAMRDRSAVLSGLIGLISCLVGGAVLLNGGALLVLLNQSSLPGDAAFIAPSSFLIGLSGALLAAGLTALHSGLLMARARMLKDRLPQAGPVRTAWWQVLVTVLIGVSLVLSYLSFGIGTTNALQRTAQARLDARADESKTALTEEEIKRNKQDLEHAH